MGRRARGQAFREGGLPKQGIGAFAAIDKITNSLIGASKHTMWHRIELVGCKPLAVGTGYFPQAPDMRGHREANDELFEFTARYRTEGYLVVFGGDLNAHTEANECPMRPDPAGDMLRDTAACADLVIVNTMADICKGGTSKVQFQQIREQEEEPCKIVVQKRTVDYVLCFSALLPHVQALSIEEDRLE